MTFENSERILFRVNPICEAFEDAWQRGERPDIRAALQGWEGHSRTVLFVHLLELDCHYRQQAGETPSADDYLHNFAEFSSDIQRVLQSPLPQDNLPPAKPTATEQSTNMGASEITQQNGSSERRLPRRLGDYELLEEIGRGGMGVVCRARQISLNRIVAVKMIHAGEFADPGIMQRFRAEAESAAHLNHAGIVPVYDVAEDGGLLFFSMAYLSGGNLSQFAELAPLSPRLAAEYTQTIARAVAYAHSRGVIHRDLKPSNILLDENQQPKVADFGLAKRANAGSDLTATGQVIGTPSYMPPEQAQGDVDQITVRSDVYTIGAILYRLLTGRPPFQAATSIETLCEVMQNEPVAPRQLNSNLPRDLETICLKCLEKSPHNRYASADELADELERFLSGRPINARPLSSTARAWRWCRRNPTVAGLSMGLVIALIVGSAASLNLARVANRRAASLLIANHSLLRAQEEAAQSAHDAHTNERLAREQSQFMLETLENVVFDVQKTLKNLPIAQETRRELLTTALDGLSHLPHQLVSEQRIKHSTASAVLSMAEALRQVGDEQGLSGASAANEYYERAVTMFEDLAEANPDDRQLQIDLAGALDDYAASLSDVDDFKRAHPIVGRALAIRRRLHKVAGQDLDSMYRLAMTLVDWSYVEMFAPQGDRLAARVGLEESLELCRELRKAKPDIAHFQAGYAMCCKWLGDWHFDFGKLPNAEPLFYEMLQVLRELAAKRPNDYNVQMEYSAAYERLGNLFYKRRNWQQAYDNYAISLELAEVLAAAAPNNTDTQWDVCVSYEKVGLVCLQMGELELARNACQRSAGIRRPLVQADPTNGKGHAALGRSLKRLAVIAERRYDFGLAGQYYQECLEMFQGYVDRTHETRFAADLRDLPAKLDRCRMGQAAVESLEFARSHTDSYHWLTVRINAQLHADEPVLAFESVRALCESAGKNPQQLYQAAQLAARCGRALQQQSSVSDATVALAVATLKQAVVHGLESPEQLPDDPAFAALKDAPVFQEFCLTVRK